MGVMTKVSMYVLFITLNKIVILFFVFCVEILGLRGFHYCTLRIINWRGAHTSLSNKVLFFVILSESVLFATF